MKKNIVAILVSLVLMVSFMGSAFAGGGIPFEFSKGTEFITTPDNNLEIRISLDSIPKHSELAVKAIKYHKEINITYIEFDGRVELTSVEFQQDENQKRSIFTIQNTAYILGDVTQYKGIVAYDLSGYRWEYSNKELQNIFIDLNKYIDYRGDKG